VKIIVKNKKAFHDYEILEKLEAGISLVGTEVKSLRNGQVSLKEAFCVFRDNELFLVKANVTPYSHGNIYNHEPERERRLLLHRRELRRLHAKVMEKGLTIVPLLLYFTQKGLIKVEIGLARGKHLVDKREDLKKKTIQREIERNLRYQERR